MPCATLLVTRRQYVQGRLEALAANVRRLRESSGLSLEELSTRLSIHIVHLRAIEGARNSPSFELLVELARALGVAEGELFVETPFVRRPRGRPRKNDGPLPHAADSTGDGYDPSADDA